MIEVADSNAAYYYHFDGLGSVVALSNSSGTTIQTYEYTVYGQVAASDPNHPNPYLFTGRRFDRETGLYYYRARYYNPYIGRFLQTDPVGYDDGINWYLYCKNNPLAYVDPYGLCCGEDFEDFWDDVDDLIEDYSERFENVNDPEELLAIWVAFWGDFQNLWENYYEDIFEEYEGIAGGEDLDDSCDLVLDCPPTEAGAKGNTGLCYDWVNPAHPGQSCYREVIPPDGSKGDTSGLHCCYDEESGTLVDEHIDYFDPAEGGGGGDCDYNKSRLAIHIWWEYIVPKIPIPSWVEW